MKSAMQILTLATILMLAGLLVGCGDNSPSDVNTDPADEEMINLNEEDGGYTKTGEEPAFGDQQLALSPDDGVEANDEVAADPVVISMAADPTAHVYVVRLAWGMLESDSTITEETDWSGSISVDRGAVFVDRIINFERGDFIERPRASRLEINLVSHTTPFYDGLIISVVNPVNDSTEMVENVLTIDMGGFTESYTVADLAEIEEIYDVDLLGNQYSITGICVNEYPCAHGFWSGEWMRSDIEGGTFAGRWSSRNGMARGHVRGNWGIDEEGNKVFFGKYIGLDGEYLGLLRSGWGHRQRPGTGWIRGVWEADGEDIEGLLRGVWTDPWNNHHSLTAETNHRHGFFHGKWFKACDPNMITAEYEEY